MRVYGFSSNIGGSGYPRDAQRCYGHEQLAAAQDGFFLHAPEFRTAQFLIADHSQQLLDREEGALICQTVGGNQCLALGAINLGWHNVSWRERDQGIGAAALPSVADINLHERLLASDLVQS